jgi:hypothetical protein
MSANLNWTEIVNAVRKAHPGLFELRDTDHELRNDSRDIINWKGERVWVPIDSLSWENIDAGFNRVRSGLLKRYNKLPK